MGRYLMIAAATAVLLLVGCRSEEKLQQNLSTWIGSSEDQLIAQWGPPSRSYDSGSGTRFLTYDSDRTVVIPGTQPTYTTTMSPYGYTATTTAIGGSPPTAINMSCAITFTVINHRVQNYSYRGNDCRS